MDKILIWVIFLGCVVHGAVAKNDIILPLLYMPFSNTEAYRDWIEQPAVAELAKKFAAIHLVQEEPDDYSIEKVYSTDINILGNHVSSRYIIIKNPLQASSISDINYYWSTNISRDDIKGSQLEERDMIFFTFGEVQEIVLKNITRKLSIDLANVAVRLNVPTRNLSYSYDPAKWEEVVRAIIEEGMMTYVRLLEVGNEDSLAALVGSTITQLKNVTIDGFLDLLPPLLPKKQLLDKNKTSEILTFTGILASSKEALIYKMVNLTTHLTVKQFGLLYNLTEEQQRVTERSTLLQFSQVCGISMSILQDKTLPNIIWDTLGNAVRPDSCSVMLRVKGKLISSFSFTNVQHMTVLQILLGICNQYWTSCRLTMSLEPSEWECFDSATLTEAATILSTNEATLLNNPIGDLVSMMSKMCKNGSHDMGPYRQNTSKILQNHFNLTANQLQSLLGITPQTYAAYTSAQLVEAFLNGSSIDLGISLSTMFNTTSKTSQELYNSPLSELKEIIPFILRSAIKSPASKLQMSDADTFTLLSLFPKNSSIAEFKFAFQNILPAILQSKTKFDNNTLSVYLTAYAITDDQFGGNSTLDVLLAASGFDTKTLKMIYRLTDPQLSVLSLLKIKYLQRYCGLDLSTLKQLTPLNVTTTLVGILNANATCKATRFFIAAKSKKISDHEATCSALSSTSTSLMRMVEECSGLTWRFNAKMFGIAMSDWPQMDALNKDNMPKLSDLSVDTVQHNTIQFLLKKANEIHAKMSAGYRDEFQSYSAKILKVLFATFNTNEAKVSQTLGITEDDFYGMNILSQVEQVQESLKKKYTISFASIVPILDVILSHIKYLAPTEWEEMLHPLINEIIASGSMQLNIAQNSAISLLQLNSPIKFLTLAQIEVAWDREFGRLLNGKALSENKTMSAIQVHMKISQESLNIMTLLTFYKIHLNLTKDELSVLFGISQQALDVLGEFYIQEIPCSCRFSEASLKNKTPYQLLNAMTGYTDQASCRNIAFLVAFRLLTINQLSTKFNVTVNETIPLLTNIESFADLPFEKIAWGLTIKQSEWPVLLVATLNDLANISSTSVLELRNSSIANVTNELVRKRGYFTLKLKQLHDALVAQASSVFALPASEACGQCSISNNDIMKTFLSHLGSIIYLNFQNLSFTAGFECIKHDSRLLLPSKWSMLVPHIIPNSFANISSLLGITKEQLADIHGVSKDEIMSMTLTKYIDITKTRIHPLFNCLESMKNEIVLTKAQSKAISVSSNGKQNVLQILTMMCSDISISNMSIIMGWGHENMTVLRNYSMEDVALCKRMPVRTVISRTLMALIKMILNEVHGCINVPCKSGTVLDYHTYTCTDINECNTTATSKCQNDQICQNYFGGYECDCINPRYSVYNYLCEETKIYVLVITILDLAFSDNLKLPFTSEFYNLKEKLQKYINNVFVEEPSLSIHYRDCRAISFSLGSIIARVHVYTSAQYKGTTANLETYMKNALNKTDGKTYLGDLQVESDAIKAMDFDECSSNSHNCHQEATCVNEEGTFSCKCKSGYDGDGVTCTASFLSTYWWLVILFAIILLILIILIIVLIIKRPKPSFSYGVGNEIAHTSGVTRSNSNVSYKNGDVFYKDKEGNVRPGTKHAEHQNPLYGRQIPENVYESRWSNNVMAMENLGAEKTETKITQDHML